MTSSLRPELTRVVEALLATGADDVSLDELGDAIGGLAVTADEIDQLIAALEASGRRVGESAPGRSGEALLHEVLAAARALRGELGRPARADEITRRSGLTSEEVRHALALARILQR